MKQGFPARRRRDSTRARWHPDPAVDRDGDHCERRASVAKILAPPRLVGLVGQMFMAGVSR
jgi:hypothetical protein